MLSRTRDYKWGLFKGVSFEVFKNCIFLNFNFFWRTKKTKNQEFFSVGGSSVKIFLGGLFGFFFTEYFSNTFQGLIVYFYETVFK